MMESKSMICALASIRSSFIAVAISLAIFSPARVLRAQPMQGNRTDGSGMMNHTDGWMGGWAGGGIWLWTVIGVLMVTLVAVVLAKRSKE